MKTLTMTTCREIAARIWCDPAFKHVAMDVEAAEEIAELLFDVADEQEEQDGFQNPG